MGAYYPPINDMYSGYMSMMTPRTDSSWLDPSDPRAQEYLDIYSQPSGAEGIFKNYLSRMPQRDNYEPSFWRKLGGALVGTFDRTGATGARNFVDQPYREAYTDWTNEGRYIDDQARVLEAERNNKLKGLEALLRMDRATKDREARASGAGISNALRATGMGLADQDRDRSLDLREQDQARKDEWNNFYRGYLTDRMEGQSQYQDLRNQLLEMQINSGGRIPTPTKPIDPIEQAANREKHLGVIRESILGEIANQPRFSGWFNPDGSIRPDLNVDEKNQLNALISHILRQRTGGR